MIVIGVTGSVLVFRPEIERIFGLKPWQRIQPREPVADIATVVDNLRAAYPRGRIVSIDAPSEDEATFAAVVEQRGRRRVACGPIEGEVLGEFPRQRNWLSVVQELHESLLIHHSGRVLNGVGAAFLLLLNVTGMVIWWPGVRNWKRALIVDFKRNWRRINFDLHLSLGFWTLLISSWWAVSGVYFGWPRQFFQFVDSFSKVVTARPPVVTVSPEREFPKLDLRAIIADAKRLDPRTTVGGIAFPYSRRAPLGILMRRREAPGYEYVDTVYFNPYDGSYISTWQYGVNKSLGDWIIWSQVPLHFGTYWGFWIKLIWVLAGLAIPILTVTGLLMYWNRALRRRWKHLAQRDVLA